MNRNFWIVEWIHYVSDGNYWSIAGCYSYTSIIKPNWHLYVCFVLFKVTRVSFISINFWVNKTQGVVFCLEKSLILPSNSSTKLLCDKKVLLRERKRHTARKVLPIRGGYPMPGQQGTPSLVGEYPIQHPGVPAEVLWNADGVPFCVDRKTDASENVTSRRSAYAGGKNVLSSKRSYCLLS